MPSFEEASATAARTETDYDALITQKRRVQDQLSAKREKAINLDPISYTAWLAKTKAELATVEREITSKKAERSEARRVLNNMNGGGGSPIDDESEPWLDEPDCEGHWWHFANGALTVVEVALIEDGEVLTYVRRDQRGTLPLQRGLFQFIPTPELPR